MKFSYSEKLKKYMIANRKKYILVEVISADTSDIEVTEIATRFLDEKMAAYYVEKKHFAKFETECGFIILPPYPVKYDETVELSLKSFLFIHLVSQKGMRI